MFVVTLRFSENKDQAKQFMDGHNDWVKQGFSDGVFLLTGNLAPGLGGAIVAHAVTLAELEHRIARDPFVAENVVRAEIIEIDPKKTDERLGFLVT